MIDSKEKGVQNKFENLCRLIIETFTLATTSSTLKEFFEELTKKTVHLFSFPLVWIGVLEGEEIRPLYAYGQAIEYLKDLKIEVSPDSPFGKGPTAEAFRSHEVVINPDSRTNPRYEAFRERALKWGLLSSCCIPIKIGNKVQYLLNFYSSEPYFFSEDYLSLLKNFKEKLESALFYFHLKEENFLLRRALSETEHAIVFLNEDFKVESANSIATFYLGALEEIKGEDCFELLENKLGILKDYSILEKIQNEGTWFGILGGRKKEERTYFTLKFITIEGSFGKKVVLILRDVSFEISLLESFETIKERDPLTEAFRLEAFLEKVDEELHFHEIEKGAMIVIDLYNFTLINELYGMEVGDKILQKVAERLKHGPDLRGHLGRTAGDEFVLFWMNVKDYYDLSQRLRKLFEILSQPYIINGNHLKLHFNMGVSLYPENGPKAKELYHSAHTACILAKQKGPNEILIYEKELRTKLEEINEVIVLIENAFKNRWFVFYYQPYFEASNLLLSGCEALIRIVKPDGEVVPPSRFIEKLERWPLRRDFEKWAIREAYTFSKKTGLSVGVNIYPESFLDRSFWKEVFSEIELKSANLVIEITERALIAEEEEEVKRVLYELKEEHGLKIALDDFGTGYSHLGLLKKLSFDIVKIDMSFIRGLEKREKRDLILVKSMIDIAHGIGAKALAEGVELEEQLEILSLMGCDYVQGFYFERPLSEEDFLKKYKSS